ncbi:MULTISPECIES: hypothetical protein [unclassified Rothia (in: high G+C Gram-positive bacteria)]|uniref:hypothetical protein n=1 Tax=unclassified Rothia (in: high G+C Gram-positive bacteria) TaxID=2689056 RepID=UPI001957D521|nr:MULTISPECIES: hypothetical protein [unclassified Rothia (in: high G+C Gram-positive bacteria)]MBM7051991.1 hypothetical protein [Rothia sp. ZJ1223]QRZ61948.1 hypothetical protein JR346_02100 [Rothia sp. ZJ932]
MAQGAGRIIGVDVARCIALFAMFAAYTMPEVGTEPVTVFSDYLAMPLFALLLGASAYFSSQQMSGTFLFASSVVRGLILIVLGLWLLNLGAPVDDVILQYLGLLSVVVVPFVFLPSWALAGVAAVIAVASPYVLQWAAPIHTQLVVEGSLLAYPMGWMFAGSHYRVFTMLCWALLGILIARGMERWGIWGDLALAAVSTLLVGGIFWYTRPAGSLLVYSGDHLEIVFNAALSAAVVGWCCVLARVLGAREVLLFPLVAPGRMTLSLYVLHVILLAFYLKQAPRWGLASTVETWPVFAVCMVGAVLFAVVWTRLLGNTALRRGPLESVMALLTGRG